MEFKITPFQEALDSGLFEKLCLESFGFRVVPDTTANVPDTSAFLAELFSENGKRLYFFTYCKNDKGLCAITNSGHFNKAESPLPYLRRVLTFLHETGCKTIFIEIDSALDDHIPGALEVGFELFSKYRLNDSTEILQFTHSPGGLIDPVDQKETTDIGMTIH